MEKLLHKRKSCPLNKNGDMVRTIVFFYRDPDSEIKKLSILGLKLCDLCLNDTNDINFN